MTDILFATTMILCQSIPGGVTVIRKQSFKITSVYEITRPVNDD
jgi:hypothetical protein